MDTRTTNKFRNRLFILDFGSGNTCKNDHGIIRKMLLDLDRVVWDYPEFRNRIVIKWQLFQKAGENIPLEKEAFDYAYQLAGHLGFKTTASVFSEESVHFLLNYDVPFVKIANRQDLYYLVTLVPIHTPVLMSRSPDVIKEYTKVIYLSCVSNYPARENDYLAFSRHDLRVGLSDHTVSWDLFLAFRPEIYECHYKLPDSTGLDSGPFARNPEDIQDLLRRL